MALTRRSGDDGETHSKTFTGDALSSGAGYCSTSPDMTSADVDASPTKSKASCQDEEAALEELNICQVSGCGTSLDGLRDYHQVWRRGQTWQCVVFP